MKRSLMPLATTSSSSPLCAQCARDFYRVGDIAEIFAARTCSRLAPPLAIVAAEPADLQHLKHHSSSNRTRRDGGDREGTDFRQMVNIRAHYGR